MMNTLPAATHGPANPPSPISATQSCFGGLAFQSLLMPLSGAMRLLSGPPKCGQSAARAAWELSASSANAGIRIRSDFSMGDLVIKMLRAYYLSAQWRAIAVKMLSVIWPQPRSLRRLWVPLVSGSMLTSAERNAMVQVHFDIHSLSAANLDLKASGDELRSTRPVRVHWSANGR